MVESLVDIFRRRTSVHLYRRNEKRKNINNVDKVCCLLTVVR